MAPCFTGLDWFATLVFWPGLGSLLALEPLPCSGLRGLGSVDLKD